MARNTKNVSKIKLTIPKYIQYNFFSNQTRFISMMLNTNCQIWHTSHFLQVICNSFSNVTTHVCDRAKAKSSSNPVWPKLSNATK